LQKTLATQRELPPQHRLVFLKSWNEWAEGNHLEPDLRYGKGYLDVIREEVFAPVRV
ncbi:MAG: glycoside hydrolase family 99-like domain-containing protein, partial [Burkholderiales bacterium]|nr:glycoside hydrolase family 99-like domain-containing protein [Burkholderiales bacterium]